ncbi:hypothetical protein EDB19DRAFT_1700111, partial [Suillus lakei]
VWTSTLLIELTTLSCCKQAIITWTFDSYAMIDGGLAPSMWQLMCRQLLSNTQNHPHGGVIHHRFLRGQPAIANCMTHWPFESMMFAGLLTHVCHDDPRTSLFSVP